MFLSTSHKVITKKYTKIKVKQISTFWTCKFQITIETKTYSKINQQNGKSDGKSL